MKRITILLEEDLLLEVQQLAKEQHVTTSQVIQQAVADYVQDQSRIWSYPPGTEEGPSQPESPGLLAERAQPAEERPKPPPAEFRTTLTSGASARRFPWLTMISLIVGGLTAVFALIEFVQAAGQLADGGQPVEVLVNYVVPGLLLGVVAWACFFIANQSRQSRST